MLGMSKRGEPRLAVDQRGAVVGSEQPLVRIDAEAVDAVDANEFLPGRRRTQRRQAVGTIDVQPQPEMFADIGDFIETVDRTGVGGTAVGNDGKDAVGIMRQHRSKRLPGHPPTAISLDRQNVDVHDPCRSADRGVGLRGGRNPPANRSAMALFGMEAGRDQCREIGRRTTGDETSASMRR